MNPHPLPEDDLRFVVDRIDPLWEDLRFGRLFMTGGTGFFGRWMLESLLRADEALDLQAEIVVLGRNPRRLPAHLACRSRLTFLQGDVREFDFPAGEFTHIVHLATDSVSVDPCSTYDVIVEGTRRALDLAAACSARKFVFASSGAVYGPQSAELGRISEDQPFTSATTPYAQGKRAAENLVCAATGFDATIARSFAFVGPGLPLDAHFAVGNFVRDALAGRPIRVQGDGAAVRSYLYAADLAVWLWTILLRGAPGRVYNVGSERALSIRELAHQVAATLGAPAPQFEAVPALGTASNRYVPNVARARRELGLERHFSLEDAIRRTASYHETKELLHV